MPESSLDLLAGPPRAWQPYALCAGKPLRLWFPAGGSYVRGGKSPANWPLTPEARRAKSICSRCPVQEDCRIAGLGESDGIWGGRDELERLRDRRALQARVKALPLAQRERIGALIARRRKHGWPMHEISRTCGLTQKFCVELIELHEAAMKNGAQAPKPSAVEWPTEPPAVGDGWIRVERRVHAGRYVAQSSDGYYLMRYKDAPTPTARWLAAKDVRLTRDVVPVSRERGEYSKKKERRAQAARSAA